jgi:hypothetical protein
MCYVQAFSCKSTDAELPFGRSASPASIAESWRWGQLRSDLSRISGRALQPLPVPAMTGSEQLGGRRLPPTLRSHNSARRPPPRWYKKRLADNFYIEQRATTTPRSSAGDHR